MKKLSHSSYEELNRLFKLDVSEDFNVGFDLVDRLAHDDPERLCIRHVDEHEVTRDITFAEFNRAASRVANALRELGVRKDDRVLLALYRRLEWWEALLGLNKLGAVAIPSPSQLTAHDLEYRINKAEAKCVIVDASIAERVDEAAPLCPCLRLKIRVGQAESQAGQSAAAASATEAVQHKNVAGGWLDYDRLLALSSENFPKPLNREELAGGSDPMMIFFSSGTTGMPKMVLHDYKYALGHAFTGLYWHDLEPGDMHLTVADTGWGKAVWGKSYGQWMAGATVFVYDYRGKFEPASLLRVLSKGGVTSFCAPPTIYRFLIREDLTAFDLSGLKKCTTAGELLNESVFHEWKAKTGLEIREGYGQTETALLVATLPCMPARPGSIGRPAPGWEVELLNESGEICAMHEEGEICVRVSERPPLGLFKEYLGEPERTSQAVRDGWYHTGDKATKDEDGYYWFMGRIDDLIKSSGYRIGPFEVESALVAHPAVVEAAVTGVPDPVRGQLVKATLVLSQGYEPSEFLTEELQEHVKHYTAPYKYPRVVEYVKELPKTISGKIKRAEIRAVDELRVSE